MSDFRLPHFFHGNVEPLPARPAMARDASEPALDGVQDAAGQRWEFGVGEGFVVPAGFEGTWEVIEDCTKFYALFEART